MDRIDAMSVLHAVVEAGSLSGAGRRLGIPLSTVSRKVSDLEAHLGARLLVRSTRTISLTEAGKAYVITTRRILEDLAEAERAAAGEYAVVKGELVITAPIVFGRLHMVPVITAFLRGLSGNGCEAGPRRQSAAPHGRSHRSCIAHREPA